jgi:hypothetical protein
MQKKSQPTSDPRQQTNWFLAFAEWRIERYSVNPRMSVRFFRQSHNHALIWAMVMRGYYTKSPPSFKDCIRSATCATETTRKIIFNGVSRGYLSLDAALEDSRKKLINPSKKCIEEYGSHVGMFLKFAEILCPPNADAPEEGA